MYKVLLVDDEPIVRVGIKERIDWSRLELTCVGDCENGMEAMDAIDRLRPDIVVTDINMPFVDGLELSRYVAEHHPLAKVIILTGYDDFAYAQQAVKLKVADFVLKPITAAEMHAMLEKAKSELDAERRKREDEDRLRRQLRESFPLLKERFLESLVTSALPSADLEERLAYFRVDLPGPLYVALAADLDRFPDEYGAADRELLRFALYNVVQETVEAEAGATAFRNRDGKAIAIVSGAAAEPLNECAQAMAETVRRTAEAYFKCTVTVGVGHGCEGLKALPASYESALTALDYRFLLGGNRVVSIADLERERPPGGAAADALLERRAVSAVKTGTEQDVMDALEAAMRYYRSAFPDIRLCRLHVQKWVIAVIFALNDLGLTEADVFGGGCNPIAVVGDCKTMDEAEAWLRGVLREAIRRIRDSREDDCDRQVRAAVDYIRSHYGDETLSLSKLCKHVHLSASYFSSVFKSRTGKTFVEFLTAERIEKAKELLGRSTLKTYEIAERVGYRDPHYFSALFRKHTGVTPTEYRQRCQAELA